MKRTAVVILTLISLTLRAAQPGGFSVEAAIEDIYSSLFEDSDLDYEQLQTELLDIAAQPIDINTATENDLRRLRFLSDAQIDDILLFVHTAPLHSLSELQLVPSLRDYELRNLLPFVSVKSNESSDSEAPSPAASSPRHEVLARLDARNIERSAPDPIYASFRYKFSYGDRYAAGVTLRRPAGAGADRLQYGAYVEFHRIWRFRTIVAGSYQAHFGQGLVVSTPFHLGKNGYVLNVASAAEGLRRYSGTDSASFHGVGATIRAHECLDITAFYSMTPPNDSLYKHTVGANLTFRYRRLRLGLTVTDNIYTDSVRYYFASAAYNQNYFRGDKQAVLGANFRWNRGKVDLFGEVAAAQNTRWGWALNAGARVTPVSDVGLLLLYRYYSPTFDNTWGYGFSESSRINDENGLYLGADIRALRRWRFALYGDIFRFSGIKYRIPYAPSVGYDTQLAVDWTPSAPWTVNFRFRAREKARFSTFSARLQAAWQSDGWNLRTRLDANLTRDSLSALNYGVSLIQSVAYGLRRVPLVFQFQAQAFDARDWNNRIYTTESDVLYAYSNMATYGLGGRFFLNVRYRVLPCISLYLKFSETLYAPSWAAAQKKPFHRSDIHLLLRLVL